MTVNRTIAVVACGMFIMLGLIANGVIQLRMAQEEQRRIETELADAADTPASVDSAIPNNPEQKPDTNPAPSNIEASPQQQATSDTEFRTIYFIKIHNGYVALFLEDDLNTPIKITDIHESTLRSYDRDQLLTGLPVLGEEALNMALEDFGS